MSDQPIRVLIVENDEDDFIIARELFGAVEGIYYAVDWAGSAADALRQFHERRHDVDRKSTRLNSSHG